jgi:hypothetical protein
MKRYPAVDSPAFSTYDAVGAAPNCSRPLRCLALFHDPAQRMRLREYISGPGPKTNAGPEKEAPCPLPANDTCFQF